jgi:hypothetical protein
MQDPELYRTLGQLVAEIQELRRLIENHAVQLDRRLIEVETDLADIKAWRNQVRGGVVAARWLWALLGTGIGGTAVAVVSHLS